MKADDLRAQNAELLYRLEEAEETIRAIRSGDVDAFVVEAGQGHKIYTLEAADRPYRLFIEEMQQGAATLQADGTIVWCNQRLAELLKLPQEKLIGLALAAFISPADREVYNNLLWQGQRQSGRGEAQLQRSDGATVIAYLTFNALPADCGAAIGVLITDLTAQKHHEELAAAHAAVQASELRYRSLTQAITSVVWTTDCDGRFTSFQPSWASFTGQQWSEMEGFGWATAIHPDDRENILQLWSAACREKTLYRSDGRVWHAASESYRYFEARGVPILKGDGEVSEWVGNLLDVDDRVRAEAAAAKRSAQLRHLAGVATRLNTIHDVQSIVGILTSEARALIGAHQSLARIARDQDNARTLAAASLSDEYAQWRGFETKPDGLNGRAAFASVSGPMRLTEDELKSHVGWADLSEGCDQPPLRGWLSVPVGGSRPGQGGFIQLSDKFEGDFSEDDEAMLLQLAHMASVAIDNSRLLEDLREADRRKDEFLATLAHELRNPLAPLGHGLQLMKVALPNHEEFEQSRFMMERQLAQMVRLIDDLLDVSRITRGKIQLRREYVELAPIILQAVESSRPALTLAGHELTLLLPPVAIPVHVDPVRVAQVVSNLLNNAGKFTRHGGQIRLAVEREADEAVIRVRDNGIGIAQGELARIFEMFTQVDTSLERAVSGLGIGLTLVKTLVELHGGRVEVQSGGLDQGSEFVVRLPVSDALKVPTTSGPGERAVEFAGRVLVVDDNRDAARTLVLLLKLSGSETRAAYDGLEAIEIAATFRPDVVLLDIGLPKLNGYEVARRIRSEPWGAKLVLVALTGWGQEEDRRKSSDAGFDAHLVKPVDHQKMMKLLSELSSGLNRRF